MSEQPPKKDDNEMPDNWDRHQLLVLSTLERLEKKTDAIYDKQHKQDKEIDRLKVKASFLGLLAGALSGMGSKFFGG